MAGPDQAREHAPGHTPAPMVAPTPQPTYDGPLAPTPLPVIRRVLKDDLLGKPWGERDVDQFGHSEVITNEEGSGSETDSFTNTAASAALEEQTLKFGATPIGTLKPFGAITPAFGGFTSGVKMHLVNSFLHPDANEWATNWVWGPQQLNVNHKGPEGLAKTALETAIASGGGLQYKTTVTEKALNVPSAEDIVDEVKRANDQEAFPALRAIQADDDATLTARIRDRVQVGGQSIAAFRARLAAGVPATAASKLSVEWRALDADRQAVGPTTEVPVVHDGPDLGVRANVSGDKVTARQGHKRLSVFGAPPPGPDSGGSGGPKVSGAKHGLTSDLPLAKAAKA